MREVSSVGVQRPRGATLRAAAVLLTLLSSLVVTAGAEAKLPVHQFEAHGKAGDFRYTLWAETYRGSPTVSLDVGSRRGDPEHPGWSSTFYLPARGRQSVSRHRINTGLGERGSIGMRFRSRSRTVKGAGCGRRVIRRGFLRGHLRFRGEAGYVRILVHRLPATKVSRSFTCRRTARRPRPVVLAACRRSGAFFVAMQWPHARPLFLAATPFRRSRGLFATTFGVVKGRPGQFTFNRDLSTARVDPPLPFRGVGSFTRSGEGGRLSGDLRGSFPATKRIRFAPAGAALGRGSDAECDPGIAAHRSSARARTALWRSIGARRLLP